MGTRAIDRFWSKVDRRDPNACWPWIGAKFLDGYPKLWYMSANRRALRVYFSLIGCPLNSNQYVCHKCDNPICANPRHLFIGSPQENSMDAYKKGRLPTPKPKCGELHPMHKLTQQDVDSIRALRKCGVSPKNLGKEFGVDRAYIWRIVTHRNWS